MRRDRVHRTGRRAVFARRRRRAHWACHRSVARAEMAGFVLRHGSPSDHRAWPSPTSTTSRACRSRNEGAGAQPTDGPFRGQPHLVKLALIGRAVASETSGRCAQAGPRSSWRCSCPWRAVCIRWPTRKKRVNGSVKPDGSGCPAGTIDSAARTMTARAWGSSVPATWEVRADRWRR